MSKLSYNSIITLILVGLMAGACLFGCADDKRAVQPEYGIVIENQEIVFLSDRNGVNQPFVMNSDGTDLLKIVSDNSSYDDPSWSPDGSMIVCTRNKAGLREICLLYADGRSPQILAETSSGHSYNPVWSPDGSKIAFESFRDGNTEVYVVNTDGSNLVNVSQYPGEDKLPSWHPTGGMVSFTSRDTSAAGTYSQYEVNADGTNRHVTSLNPNFGDAGDHGIWSYDEELIAILNHDNSQVLIYYDSSYQNFLTLIGSLVQDIRWSPVDQTFICSIFDPSGRQVSDIVRLDVPAVGITYSVNSDGNDLQPNWRPDGNQIAFVTDRDGNEEIYRADADGSNQVNLTNDVGRDFKPDWR